MTVEEIKKLIPRDKDGKLDCVKFYEINFWKDYKIKVAEYLDKNDSIELYKYANYQMTSEAPFKEKFDNKEKWIIKCYNDNLEAIRELEGTLPEHFERENN